MANVLMPIPALDFDPTEVAVSWRVLTARGHRVSFATPDGRPGVADDIMLTGRGLSLFGRLLRADASGRAAYAEMLDDRAFQAPFAWADAEAVDGLLLPGGHRARGMREYLENEVLQRLVARAFAADLPVAAICHGVVLAARSQLPATGRSVLFGRKTTALTWRMERSASRLAHIGRPSDRNYYRTYVEGPGEGAGYRSVQQEVTRALASAEDFMDVPANDPEFRLRTGGLARDTTADPRPAFVVRDGRYVSARWPGDTHTFAAVFAGVLDEVSRQSSS